MNTDTPDVSASEFHMLWSNLLKTREELQHLFETDSSPGYKKWDAARLKLEAAMLPLLEKERKPGPLMGDDGKLECCTLKIAGKPYRCHCGANVFHHPDKSQLSLYECNGCNAQFEAE